MRDKFERASDDFAAFARCTHEWEFVADHPMDRGVVGKCRACRVRVTAWPGCVHYDEIAGARSRRA